MTLEEYKAKYTEEDPVGWLAIDQQLDQLYPNQEPRHYAPVLHYAIGGDDPLDGTSIYNATNQYNHKHLISYGMSELYYNEERVGDDYSKWGFEFTMRVKANTEDEDPRWAVDLMNNLARYVFETQNWFEPYHFVPTNGPIKQDEATDIVGVLFVEDPELKSIQTAHGQVTFLQIVGITSLELEIIRANPTIPTVQNLVQRLQSSNSLLITDLARTNPL
ncbi:MAG: suppressor of fused domain protein [Saprospiraceae bacterium]|nr:suppressor of fused domain protein [Saprospiraceae bacterium]